MTSELNKDIPVWDAYIEKVVIYIWNNLYTGSHHYNNYN